jgi:hypothetical protein
MGFQKQTGGDGEVMRNKAHLVAQGFSQLKGLDFGETFAHVAHLEAIRILLAFVTSKGFKPYQMDVKSAFLNSVIQEEVFVRQSPGFENPKYPNRVYKLSKTLYGLKQASLVWYVRLKTFFLEHGYVMECVDKTIFTLKHDNDFFTCSDLRGRYHLWWLFSYARVKFLGNDGGVSDVHDGRTNIFLRYPSQANEASYLHTSSQVHK